MEQEAQLHSCFNSLGINIELMRLGKKGPMGKHMKEELRGLGDCLRICHKEMENLRITGIWAWVMGRVMGSSRYGTGID